jgi:hypothetical protein
MATNYPLPIQEIKAMTTAHLTAAIDRLSAIRVSETEYAYYAEEVGEYVSVPTTDLEDFGRRIEADAGTDRACDTYSLWCAESDGKFLGPDEPDEWEPTVSADRETDE